MANKISYLLRVSYDGSSYYGSQKQADKPTIEQSLRQSVEKYFKISVPLVISSRTDRGVHSLDHPILIKLPFEIDTQKTARNLNWVLPDDIQVLRIEKVNPDFHPRYHSKEKTYRYRISKNINVFNSRYVTYYRNYIDVKKLEHLIPLIVGKHNFVNFTTKNPREDYVRNVLNIQIKSIGDEVIFYITGTGFLRYMVRNIIACFLDYNEGVLSLEDVSKIVNNEIEHTFKRAEPNGLCLLEVKF